MVTFNAMISNCERAQRWETSLNIMCPSLRRAAMHALRCLMLSNGQRPDLVSFNAAMSVQELEVFITLHVLNHAFCVVLLGLGWLLLRFSLGEVQLLVLGPSTSSTSAVPRGPGLPGEPWRKGRCGLLLLGHQRA